MTSTSWYWNNSSYDWDIYAHVFDQNGKNSSTNNIPIRYANNTTDYYTTNNIPQCTNDNSVTNGNTLYSGIQISSQYSCNPDTLNAGNWYNYPAATAGSNNISTSTEKDVLNSICPKGWRLPPNDGPKSYNHLIRDIDTYHITATDSDATLLANSAMSFVRLGVYTYGSGSLDNRGRAGIYWSSTAYSSVDSHDLNFNPWLLDSQHGNDRAYGFSIRCVSR